MAGFARGASSALTREGSSALVALASSSSSSSSSSGEGMSYFLARSAAASALEPGLCEEKGRGGGNTMCEGEEAMHVGRGIQCVFCE